MKFALQLTVHPDAEAVSQAEAAVKKLQAGVEPEVHGQPKPGWSRVLC